MARRTKLVQCRLMLRDTIALVLRETVAGRRSFQPDHQSVACDLGNDGGGCNAEAAAIPFDKRLSGLR